MIPSGLILDWRLLKVSKYLSMLRLFRFTFEYLTDAVELGDQTSFHLIRKPFSVDFRVIDHRQGFELFEHQVSSLFIVLEYLFINGYLIIACQIAIGFYF